MMREGYGIARAGLDCAIGSRITGHSIPQSGIHVRAVNGTVASCGPTSGPRHQGRMGGIADEGFIDDRILVLRMASQAQVRVVIVEHFAVDRAMWVVTRGATLAHGFVLEHNRARLFTMALGAAFVESRHRQSAGRFENVIAMRVVALNTIHFALNHGMMLGQIEFSLNFEVALKT